MEQKTLSDRPAVAVWWYLARSFNLLAREGERAIAPFGLTGPQLGVLRCIHDAGGSLPTSRIGERMLVTGANITGVVDRLERDGYVVRERDGADRRVVLVRLTPEGRRRGERAVQALMDHVTDLLQFLTPHEQRSLADQLEQLDLHLKKGTSA